MSKQYRTAAGRAGRAAALLLAATTMAASPPATVAQTVRSAGVAPTRLLTKPPKRPHDLRARALVVCSPSTDGTFTGGGQFNLTGGTDSGVLAGFENSACDSQDAIAGGAYNGIGGNGNAGFSFIGGGFENLINVASGDSTNSFIGAGSTNSVATDNSGVMAGENNSIEGSHSAIAGGYGNDVAGAYGLAGGGYGNSVGGEFAFGGGGQNNRISGKYAVISGGLSNSATGAQAFVGGGYGNVASGAGAFVGAGGSKYLAQSVSGFNVASGLDSYLGGGDANAASGTQSFLGAGQNNTTSGGEAFVGSGYGNAASGGYAFIGAGYLNAASSYDNFIGAGYSNANAGEGAFLGAGGLRYLAHAATRPNSIGTRGTDGFVGAGDGNTLNSFAAFIGGGQYNTISAPAILASSIGGAYGAIGGGYGNSIVSASSNPVQFGFIGGGEANSLKASYTVVGGGDGNQAEGTYATVPGGWHNIASGAGSFAAGTAAYAAADGSFVWSDDAAGAARLKASLPNLFLARASGGVKFFSNAAMSSGVSLDPGSGTWASLSDRTMKTRIVPLDDAAILTKLASLPVSEWSYRSEDPRVRHVGPMAQDFYAAFRVGEDDRHITTIDEDGVALAAIKALATKAQRAEVKSAQLKRQLDALTEAVRRLTRAQNSRGRDT
jgi:hypothetical protein